MTELEQYIKGEAEKRINELLSEGFNIECESRYINFPVIIDGVVDYLIFDKEVNRFTKIMYSYGIGKATVFEHDPPSVGYFDSCETREILL